MKTSITIISNIINNIEGAYIYNTIDKIPYKFNLVLKK